jgi:CHAD domain-containing protein
MDSERWQSMIRAVDAAARLPPLRGSVAPAAKARKKVRALLRESWRRLERRAQQAERDEIGFHEVRKAAKSTRYAAELFEPVIGDDADALARATEDIQTELGEQQDSVVACEWLRRHADHVQIGGTADELCASLDRGPVRRPDRWRRMWKKARRAAEFVA